MTKTRIWVDYVQGGYLRDYEKHYVPMVREDLRLYGTDSGLVLADNPSQADVIILWEGFEYKTADYITTLETDPLVRGHAERLYAINYDDHPEGFLAGMYTSLEEPFFNSEWHRIWPFVLMNNPVVYDLTPDQLWASTPTLLFSFTGAASHEVRKRLFATYGKSSSLYHVQHIKRWYDHGEAERQRFVQIALNSEFCLCPHGYCSYTPRIAEVMAMGRVPVIIADDWIPFSFEDDLPYFVRVAERDIDHLPDILSDKRPQADEYRHNARALWEKYCSPTRRVTAAVECIVRFASRPGSRPSYDEYRDLWRSRAFLKKLGWTSPQLLALRMEQHVRRWIPAAKIPGVTPLIRYRNAPNLK